MVSCHLCSRLGLYGPSPPAPLPGGRGETATGNGVAVNPPHGSVAAERGSGCAGPVPRFARHTRPTGASAQRGRLAVEALVAFAAPSGGMAAVMGGAEASHGCGSAQRGRVAVEALEAFAAPSGGVAVVVGGAAVSHGRGSAQRGRVAVEALVAFAAPSGGVAAVMGGLRPPVGGSTLRCAKT